MYEPRRSFDETGFADDEFATVARPRRAAFTWRDSLAERTGGTLVVLAATATAGSMLVSGQAPAAAVAADAPARELAQVSRDLDRTVVADELVASALTETTAELVSVTRLYAKSSLNVRAEADSDAKKLGTLKVGDKVTATSDVEGKYRRIEYKDGGGWVLAASLAKKAPTADQVGGITMAPCSRGSAVEARLRSDTIRIYRSVCALFPGVNSYGGWRPGGLPFHRNGRAIDIMLTPGAESAMGWRIANYLVKNAGTFNIDHIIFEQKIWTPNTPRWRHMADRGGITANHYDHVHVAIRA